MMKIIAIVAGGPTELIPDLTQYDQKNVIWVGIDRGVEYLHKANLPISHAFGDFDSISAEKLQKLNRDISHLSMYPAEKDYTDTELALEWAVEQIPEKIFVFGATGGRIDHLLGNLQLLLKHSVEDVKIHIIDRQNQITLYTSGTYTIEKQKDWKFISFIPVSETISSITLQGFKYSLNNCHIQKGSTLCISNELIHEQGTFSFTDGILLMIRSRD